MDQASATAHDTSNLDDVAAREAAAMQEAAQAVADALKEQAAQEAAPTEDAAQAEIASLKDQLLRSMAETENVRRRAQRDLEDGRKYAVQGFARDLSGVIENLYRAIGSITPEQRKASDVVENLAVGLDMTLQDMTSMLERHGMKRIWPEGQAFDHNHHQAVAQIDNNDHPAGTILQVLQAGYIIHDRLLQPAMVCVSRPSTGHVDTQA